MTIELWPIDRHDELRDQVGRAHVDLDINGRTKSWMWARRRCMRPNLTCASCAVSSAMADR